MPYGIENMYLCLVRWRGICSKINLVGTTCILVIDPVELKSKIEPQENFHQKEILSRVRCVIIIVIGMQLTAVIFTNNEPG